MRKLFVISLVLAFGLMAGQAMAETVKGFHAMKKVANAKPMSHDELRAVEGGALIFGSTFVPIAPMGGSIGNFLNEVLLTQLGVGGRSPVEVHTSVGVSVTQQLGGGVLVSLTPNTYINAKNLYCTTCYNP